MRIVSNNICFGPMPQPDDEMEQHLTINDKDRVWFSVYNFGNAGERYKKARTKDFKIEKALADKLLNALATYFGNEYIEIFATDIGDWVMELTNTEGATYKFRGSLCADFDYEGIDLSDLVRDTVGIRDLYDVNNIIRFGLFDESESELLKKCTLFYMTVGNEKVPIKIDIDKIDEIIFHKIHMDLLPVKRKAEEFNLLKTQEFVKSYITDLMCLTEREEKFMLCFRQKKYYPELLFDDEMIVERLKKHPMALWKMRGNYE